MSDELLYRDEAYRIIGACMAVHKDKGNGFVEPVYQDALEIELELTGIPFDAQRNYQIHYRERPLKHTYTPDLLCFDKIIVELKAAKALTDEHRAQLVKIPGASPGAFDETSANPIEPHAIHTQSRFVNQAEASFGVSDP